MDFLKGGFKSTRFPKRYIRLVNEKGFKVGVDLSKYEKFNSHIKKLVNKEDKILEDEGKILIAAAPNMPITVIKSDPVWPTKALPNKKYIIKIENMNINIASK